MDVSWDTQADPYTTDFEDFFSRAGGAAESVSRQIVDDAICGCWSVQAPYGFLGCFISKYIAYLDSLTQGGITIDCKIPRPEMTMY